MKKFVKLTTKNSDGTYRMSWVDRDIIVELVQITGTQAENNEGTCETINGAIFPIVGFNETLETL